MKSFLLLPLAALAAAKSTTTTDTALPKSTDAASFISEIYSNQPTPTWATGKYETTLASALYPLVTSFAGRSDYTSLIDAIWSGASKDGGDEVLASLSQSGWYWDSLASEAWYTKNVPKALQTEVVQYDDAWESAVESVASKATATGNAAPARCTGGVVAGVAVGVAAVVGMM